MKPRPSIRPPWMMPDETIQGCLSRLFGPFQAIARVLDGDSMKKPHEETWCSDDDGSVYVGTGVDRMTFLDPSPGPPADMDERGRLAAQAPAMARLLLELREDPDLDDYAHSRTEEVLRSAGVLP